MRAPCSSGIRDMRPLYVLLSILTLSAIVGCGSVGPANRDPAACPQTGEFANFGCARFAAVLTTPSGAPAVGIALTAALLDAESAGQPNGLSSQRSDAQGHVGLQFTWYAAPPKRDTVRVRVVALRIDALGGPAQRIDSLDVRLVFVPVGQRPPLDTARWQLRQ